MQKSAIAGGDTFSMATTRRHKVFVSYHHSQDEGYKTRFCKMLGSDIVDKSVTDGDIDVDLKTDTIRQKIRDEFISDASVTVVLTGRCTWQRKHIDWEIGSSLRDTKKNARCGVLGILLPNHYDFGRDVYRGHLIPPRLTDNSGGNDAFAAIYDWPRPWSTDSVRNWIHHAFERRSLRLPTNARPQFGRNRSGRCDHGWSE